MKRFKKGLRLTGLLAAGIVTGTALIMAVFLLPVGRMQGHVRESEQLLRYEFENNLVIYGFPFTLTGLFTDCIMLQSAVYTNEEHSLPEAALGVYRREQSEETWAPGEALLDYLNGQEPPVEVDYARYWHGYLVFLKPLLCVFNVSELRLLGFVLQGILGAGILWGFYLRRRMRQGMAFFATILLMMPLTMVLSLSLSVCIYILFTAVLIQLFFHDRLRNGRYAAFFLLTGMSAAFFDLLTYPLVTLGIPLTMELILESDREKKGLKTLTAHAAAWTAGYGGMWAGKWIVADLLLHKGVIADAIGTVLQRTGPVESKSRLETFFTALGRNFGELLNWPYLLLAALGLALLAWDCLRPFLRPAAGRGAVYRRFPAAFSGPGKVIDSGLPRNGKVIDSGLPRNGKVVDSGFSEHRRQSGYLAYVLIMLLPVLWFFLAANHSAEHWMFTCRILGVSIFAMLCAVLKWRRPN